MRYYLTVAKRAVVIFAICWLGLIALLTVVFDLPLFFAWAIAAPIAGGIAWFAIDMALLPEELEEDAKQSLEDRSRRSFLDGVRRQGPGPRPRGDQP